MWWETLPSFALVISFLSLPQVGTYFINLLFLKNPYSRDLVTHDDIHHYLRDMRLSGINNPYKQLGLECLGSGEGDAEGGSKAQEGGSKAQGDKTQKGKECECP